MRIAASEDDDAEPWLTSPSRKRNEPAITDPLPKQIRLTLSDQIYVEKDSLPPALRNRLLRTAAFQNPEFYKAQSMRLPTWDKPRIVSCAEDYDNHIALPRGCMEDVQTLLSDLGIDVDVQDRRFEGEQVDLSFQGELRPGQQVAVEQMMKHDTGVLSATTAFGKTVVAAWMIAARGVNTLILVHRRQLLDQWVDRLSAFLNVSTKDIGRIGGGRRKTNGQD